MSEGNGSARGVRASSRVLTPEFGPPRPLLDERSERTVASPDWPIDEAPGRDVRAPIPETFRLESGERLAATAVDGRVYGPPEGPLVVVAGGISADRRAKPHNSSTISGAPLMDTRPRTP